MRSMNKPKVNRLGDYQLGHCANGVGLVLRPMPHARSVSVGVWVRVGGRYEKPQVSGISHFVEHLLFKGTRTRSCEQLKQQIEGVGGSLNGFTAEEFTCYMAKVPKRFARRAVTVLADMVCGSLMTARDVNREREVILEEIRMYEDSPGQLIHDYFNELLWPNHPLGALLSGTLESVGRISRNELRRYWKRMYQPRSMLVTCFGALEPSEMVSRIQEGFGRLQKSAVSRYPRAPRPRKGVQARVWNKKTEQTHLCLGVHAVARTHPDRFAMEMLNVILGANMSSRLFREVRERRGLVYEIGTQIKRFEDAGAFVVYAGCDTSKLTHTIKTIVRELSRIRKGLVSRAELIRAKDYYAGQLEMGLEDTMDHMLWAGEQAITVGRIAQPAHLLKRLSRVQATDIRRVARQLFQTPKINLAVIGPLEVSKSKTFAKLCRID